MVQMVVGPWASSWLTCRPDEGGCCSNGDEGEEMLTKAYVDHMDMVSLQNRVSPADVQAEPALPCQAPTAEQATGSHGGAGQRETTAPASPASSSLTTLQVPPEFDVARVGVAQPLGGASKCDTAEQRRCLQASLQAFTRSLLVGVHVSVLLDDCRTRLAEARLDSELTHLVLHVPHTQHPVALQSIEAVHAGEVAPAVSPTHQSLLGDRCVTLIIEGGQFLTFVFDEPRIREYFEVCLKIVILARERGAGTAPPARRCNMAATIDEEPASPASPAPLSPASRPPSPPRPPELPPRGPTPQSTPMTYSA